MYPNDDSAPMALDQSAISLCAAFHDSAYNFALEKPDLAIVRPNFVGWSHQYNVKPSVLMSIRARLRTSRRNRRNYRCRPLGHNRPHRLGLPWSTVAQDSMITREIEIDPGSNSFDSDVAGPIAGFKRCAYLVAG